jgi:Domain of unknown function (DUF4258)
MPNDELGVAVFRLTAAVAQQRIRALAKDSSNVWWSKHSRTRMEEREIVTKEVYRILQEGDIAGQPVRSEKGEWKCKMVLKLKGRRSAGVVVALTDNTKLAVITVEWEDEP